MKRACTIRLLGAAALVALLLHGASVAAPDRRSVEYAAGSGRASVSYSRNADGAYTFQFVDTEGKVTVRSFRPEGR